MKLKDNNYGHQGFSLVEVLVAIALMATVFTLVTSTSDSRGELEESILHFDRAVKVASNESILRNTVTRIFIDFEAVDEESEETTVTYSVQFGPSGGLVLPKAEDLSKIGLNDLEKYEERQKKFNSKFNTVADFEKRVLPEDIKFQGVASSYIKDIQTEGKLSIYFYPTGERDDAVIFLTSNNELAYLKIQAFSDQTILKYAPLSKSELDNPQDSLDNKIKEVHSQWLSN